METPFIYGKLVGGNHFTNRDKERSQLAENFKLGTNTVLISPRRWGKSSLVLEASEELREKEKKIKFVFIDLFNIRSEEDFYKELAEKVIQSVSDKMEDVISNVKGFMKQWAPNISFSPDSEQTFSLSLNWSELKKRPD